MSRSLKICAQVESGTIVAGYSEVAPEYKFSLFEIVECLMRQTFSR